MRLTAENYFEDRAHMSASQFKRFMDCEACALAEIEHRYEREVSTALLQGQYVDAHFTGDGDAFKAEHPEMFKKDGELKAAYSACEAAIARVRREPKAMEYLRGEKQVIVTGEICGVPCKGKLDVLGHGRIVDLKCMRSFEPIYKDGERVDFIRGWGYDIQAYFYTELVKQLTNEALPFYILAVTKEAEPDIMLVEVPTWLIRGAGEVVQHYIERFAAIKEHAIEPKRCGRCGYCKSTKRITGPIMYEDFLKEVLL